MPARRVPEWEKEKREDLRKRYGGMLNLTDVQKELGLRDPKTARAFLAGVPSTVVCRRRKWAVEDLARKLYEEREVAAS